MPRRGERAKQAKPPVRNREERDVDHIGIRETRNKSARDGKLSRLNPADFQCSVLAGQLADEMIAYVRRNPVSVAQNYSGAIRNFVKFVDIDAVENNLDPALIRLDSASVDVPEIIHRWEVWVKSQYSPASSRPYSMATCLLVLIRQRARRDQRVPAALKARAEAKPLYKKPTPQPLDEFSNAERLGLRDAARADIRKLEARLEMGRRLLEQGVDPRTDPGGWLTLPNLVWAAHNRILTIRDLKPHLLQHNRSVVAAWPQELRELTAAMYPHVDVYALVQSVGRLLFPNEIDLLPYFVLLLLEADCTSEEIHDLTLEGIEFTDGGVRLVQTKNRAHYVRPRLHLDQRHVGDERDAVDVGQALEFAGSGRWDVPGLLRRVLAVTQPARSVFGDLGWLWLAVECREKTALGADVAQFKMKYRRFAHWIASHAGDTPPLVISQPYEVRRLRKTARTARVVALGGTVSDLAGDQHSVEVFRGHYAHGTTAHVLSARAINRAQQWVFDKITGDKPLFIPEDAEARLAEPEVAEAAGMTAQEGAAMQAGEMDMGLSNCRNPYNSDYTPGGKLCHVRPAMCMLCRNAVVFTSQIPRLLMFADHIDRQRFVMDPPRWQATWGEQSAALEQLFAEVGEARIAKARQQIIDEKLVLDLPLGMRTEYDR
jgi:hypothetical protein